MKSAVLHGIEDIRIEERPRPAPPAPDEVQIRVRVVGLCGSDLKYFYSGGVSSNIQKPFVLGHEASGEVLAVGDQVSQFVPGDRVAIEPGKPCWRCEFCRRGDYNLCPSLYFMASRSQDGALQEYLNWPANLVFRLPDRVSYDEGALVEPLSVALSSVQRGDVGLGKSVLVLGAGPIGLSVLQFAKLAGAASVTITDMVDTRLSLAESLGVDRAVRIGAEDEVGLDAQSMDVVIDTTGSADAIKRGYDTLKPGGTMVLVGLAHDHVPLSLIEIVYRQLTIRGVYRFKNTYPTVLQCLESGKIQAMPLITHRYGLDDTSTAFRTAKLHERAVKVMVEL